MKHIPSIKKALGIAGVYTAASAFYQRGTKHLAGVQIDLLLDRNDHIINLFEIKFYNTFYSLTKAETKRIREKMAIFQAITQTKKHIFVSLITTFGMLPNQYSSGLVENVLTLEDLFKD